MIKLLPFIIIPILIVAGLGYWRYSALKQSSNSLQAAQAQTQVQDTTPIEVPKTLPNESTEDRVKSLEDTVSKLAAQVNSLKSSSQVSTSGNQSTSDLQSSVTELKARVSALEKASPAPGSTSTSTKSVVYIPLGSGGGPWADKSWYSIPEYEISLDPADYPGYTGMSLEVIFRLTQTVGTASVRLYNTTDSTSTSGQVDTTSTSYGLYSTSSFKLASGRKTYNLQEQSTQNTNILIQSARIKVSF